MPCTRRGKSGTKRPARSNFFDMSFSPTPCRLATLASVHVSLVAAKWTQGSYDEILE